MQDHVCTSIVLINLWELSSGSQLSHSVKTRLHNVKEDCEAMQLSLRDADKLAPSRFHCGCLIQSREVRAGGAQRSVNIAIAWSKVKKSRLMTENFIRFFTSCYWQDVLIVALWKLFTIYHLPSSTAWWAWWPFAELHFNERLFLKVKSSQVK